MLLGTTGIGKTWQLKTLDEPTTLFVDLEAGDLTVKDWRGDAIRPRKWEECRPTEISYEPSPMPESKTARSG